MFILDLLFFRGFTEIIWLIILALGVLAWLASLFISLYKTPLQVIGTLVIILSVYNLGMAANESKWQERIDKLEEQVKKNEDAAKVANEKLSTEINEKKKIAQQKQKEVIKYIDKFVDREVLKTVEGPERVRIEKVIEYVEKCPVPKEFIDAHNQAAQKPNGKVEGDKK